MVITVGLSLGGIIDLDGFLHLTLKVLPVFAFLHDHNLGPSAEHL